MEIVQNVLAAIGALFLLNLGGLLIWVGLREWRLKRG